MEQISETERAAYWACVVATTRTMYMEVPRDIDIEMGTCDSHLQAHT